MSIKVSVIIPVYNVENYLEKCLNSVINQTLRDIEIICINDGSNDKSLGILEKFAEIDNRIKILSSENRGAGAARNHGLSLARGEYISFVDSDDWIELNMYEKLYTTAVSTCVDMIFFKMINYNNQENEYYNTDYYDLKCVKEFFTGLTYDFHDLKDYLFCLPVSPCNKLYKRKFLEETNSKFNEGLIFEDNPFFFNNILNAKKILLCDNYFYFRRRIKNSVMASVNTNHFDIIPITNEIIKIFRNKGLFEKFKRSLVNKKLSLIRNLVYNNLNDKYKAEFFKQLKNDFYLISVDKDLSKDYENNLTSSNLFFYLNSYKTDNFKEFDLLNKNSDLKLKLNRLEQDFERKYKLLSEINSKLNKKNSKLNKKNDKLNKKYNRLNEKNINLNNAKNKLESELNDVYSSNSWKITKPIRKISDRIK